MKMKHRFVLDEYFDDNPMPVSGGDLSWWNQRSGFADFSVASKCEVRLTGMALDFSDCNDGESDPLRSPLEWVKWMRSLDDESE